MTNAPSRQSVLDMLFPIADMTRKSHVGRLLEELEQEFPSLSRERPVRLVLQATQILACQHLARLSDAKGVILLLLDQMIGLLEEDELRLHVHCLRNGIAFDFSTTLPTIPPPLSRLLDELGAHLSPWQDGLRLEFPREFSPASSNRPASAPNREFASLHGHRILLIEDDTLHRQSLALSLMRAGLQVDSCRQKDAGLEIAVNGQAFSALVVHIPHPLCSGIGLLHRLRDAGITQPLIALATLPEPGDHDLCRSSGGTALLPKQTSAHALLEALALALHNHPIPPHQAIASRS